METENAINALIAHAKKESNYKKGDKITIVVSNPNFHHDISTVVQSDVKATEFMKHIAKILSSNEHLDIMQCRFNVKIFSIPRGSGKCAKIINLANDVRTKKCITQIKNNDNLCCPRAIITALTYHTDCIFGAKRNIKDIRKGRKVQTELAEELCKMLGDYNEEGFTLEDIKNVEELLNIQVKVVCAESFNSIIYSGEEKETKIYLYKNGNHFDVINIMKAFLGSCYYCCKCDKPYNNKNKHRCSTRTNACKLCTKPAHSEETKNKIYCENCNRYCFNQDCFNNHNDVCKEVYKCLVCNKITLRAETHMCGYSRCRNCEEIVKTGEHQCYMQPKNQKLTQRNTFGLITKQNKIPGFTSQNLLWPIILMVQSSASRPTRNFANG